MKSLEILKSSHMVKNAQNFHVLASHNFAIFRKTNCGCTFCPLSKASFFDIYRNFQKDSFENKVFKNFKK